MSLWDTILSFVFPGKCAACGEAGGDLCGPCLEALPRAERECANWIFPVYDYRDPRIKKALWLFKYKGRKTLAREFARAMYDTMLPELAERRLFENFTEPCLVPIPLSAKRFRERGYNQAELLCLEISKLAALHGDLPLQVTNRVLMKPEDTEHQARIKNRRARLQNMRGTFVLRNPDAIQGKNIILVDDILTTGATLAEARMIMKKAGARKVFAVTVAH